MVAEPHRAKTSRTYIPEHRPPRTFQPEIGETMADETAARQEDELMEASQAPFGELPVGDVAPEQRCILVVDDERTVLSVTARMLSGAGYSVLEATGAREALQLLAEDPSRVDLVVTDVVMPETDGRALGRVLAECDL